MTPRRAFLVRRFGLYLSPESRMFYRDTLNTPGDDPRTVPVAVFADRAAAEARARELEREARRLVNPFWSGNEVEWKSSVGTDGVCARLVELGLRPPPAKPGYGGREYRPWRGWWEEQAPGWPDDLFHAVWDLLDRERFYEVAEVELED